LRSYLGGPSDAIADRTVFRDTPSTRAITLIGYPPPVPRRGQYFQWVKIRAPLTRRTESTASASGYVDRRHHAE